MMAKRHILAVLGVVVLLAASLLVWRVAQPHRPLLRYTTAKIDKGGIRSYVSATGTVNPVTLIEVSSPLSGIIKTIYVDFNTKVKQGDALAEIDPTPFQSQLKQAQANVKKAAEEVRMTRNIMQENADLYRKRLMSKEEYEASKSKHAAAQASYELLQAVMEMAQSHLALTTVRAPIDGIVVSKNVNVGQTVAASLQAPVLFLIADDLIKMKLDTHVSEADIGKIEEGQSALFRVDAYPERTFEGSVWQIRHVPAIIQNVVMYDVVLLIENPDLKLKPGMTAEVDILVAARPQALRVPRAALRFVPPPAALIGDVSQVANGAAVVWTLQRGDRLQAVAIQPGISDEQYTELVGQSLREGDEVVVEVLTDGASGAQPLGSVLPQPKRF
jgi:HlyD family secretion protein